jgi:hypothetical protein
MFSSWKGYEEQDYFHVFFGSLFTQKRTEKKSTEMGFNVHLPSVLLLFASFYDSSIENNVERARRRKETAKGIEGEEEPKLASALEETDGR